ncbi:MAG: hypothetical protein WCI74_13175, partial [Actinomycetes bacterium]
METRIAPSEPTKIAGKGLIARRGAAALTVLAAAISMFGISSATSANAAAAQEPSRQNAQPLIIGMGDSFMSGEGGRFAGNVYQSLASDGAYDSGNQNFGWQVYRDAWNNTMPENKPEWRCHRSDSSVVNTLAARNPGSVAVNLACSGAVTDNILTTGQQGEKSQLAQLRQLVANPAYRVSTIAVSIGGNDMKFGKVMTDCTQITSKINCGTNGEKNVLTAVSGKAGTDITKTLDAITAVMREAGYADGSYNFVYQSAPNLFATSGNRYGTPDNWFGNSYGESPGVPMSNGTVDWMKTDGQPYINTVMANAVARANNPHITFLDATNAFSGHELSNTATQQIKASQVSKLGYPVAATAEWVVPINSNYIAGSIANTNRQQESYHPNRFGQQALAACIGQAIKTGGSGVNIAVTCTATAKQGPNQVTVT